MSAQTTIEWTDCTFNPWRGCTKVSPGCTHCYAEVQSKRNPGILGEWGPNARRAIAAESGWKQPVKWNHEAMAKSVRRRVFVASMADVFEDRPELVEPRTRLFRLVQETPSLDWLLLTKRPENIRCLWPGELHGPGAAEWPNVWLGTSIENQDYTWRAEELVQIDAMVRFVSAEPLLGPLDLSPWLGPIDWVIVGGESGPKARPMKPEWVRSIRNQCQAAAVPFFCKQDSGPKPGKQGKLPDSLWQIKQFPDIHRP